MIIKIACPISPGELADKLSILKIKIKKITDPDLLQNVQTELNQLQTLAEDKFNSLPQDLLNGLQAVNEALWDLEDNIRAKIKESEFDQEFIDIACRICATNDQRFSIKSKINEKLKSPLREVKSYSSY